MLSLLLGMLLHQDVEPKPLSPDRLPERGAATPVSKVHEEWWLRRHLARIEDTRRGADIAFLGDSITQGWEKAGKHIWDQFYAPRGAVNFGVAGDRIEHMLWRLDNGEVLGSSLKIVVVMAGTNNIAAGMTPEQTADGMSALVQRVRERSPDAKLLIMSVLPRAARVSSAESAAVRELNRLLKDMQDGEHVHYLNIYDWFTYSDGQVKYSLLPDGVHLSPPGYQHWFQSMEPTLSRLLNEQQPQIEKATQVKRERRFVE